MELNFQDEDVFYLNLNPSKKLQHFNEIAIETDVIDYEDKNIETRESGSDMEVNSIFKVFIGTNFRF